MKMYQVGTKIENKNRKYFSLKIENIFTGATLGKRMIISWNNSGGNVC